MSAWLAIAGGRLSVTQASERIFAVALAGDDERVDDRGAVASVGMADEESVFRAVRILRRAG